MGKTKGLIDSTKPTANIQRPTRLQPRDGYWLGEFEAMASPCEVLIATQDKQIASQLLQIASQEAWRIEQKYSRYHKGSVVSLINTSCGKEAVEVDTETAGLIEFAFQCYALSDGLFDISSGVLRRVWRFDGSDNVPTTEQVNKILPLVGLEKCSWDGKLFSLKAGMEIDFGGIGKEYAVDRSLLQMSRYADVPILVNFGGDMVTNRTRSDEQPWHVGIETASIKNQAVKQLNIYEGALATSGDSCRFLLKDGIRYSHVLNPKTGWPVAKAPRSVTVAQATCTQAGILSTLAILQGSQAENYLTEQETKHWVLR